MSLLTIRRVRLSGGAFLVSLRGSLDASNAEAFGTAIGEVLDQGARHVLLNLKEAVYISSRGFSLFLKTVDDVVERGGRVIFVGTPPRIKEIFKVLGLLGTLAFATDEEAALAYLAGLSSDPAGAPSGEHP